LKFARDTPPAGIEVTIANFTDVPFYNEDLQELPKSVQIFKDNLAQADALFT